jgi:hypothetical protein
MESAKAEALAYLDARTKAKVRNDNVINFSG